MARIKAYYFFLSHQAVFPALHSEVLLHAGCEGNARPSAGKGLHLMHACVGAQIHWFSIFNSSMILIFLTGLVAMILMRTLRADYARYTARDEDDLEVLRALTLF